MIYVTGDTHGDPFRFTEANMCGEAKWTSEDLLIVCGDFGYIFANDEKERLFLDELEEKPYTICFCDGNHENFAVLNSYPKELWNGRYVHRIRKNIVHLMRGQYFTISGKTFFAMGGAYSTDKYMRFENLSWWKEELPSDSEYKEAIKTLKENSNRVDYIITHTAPREIIRRIGKYPDRNDMELTGFLEWIMYEVTFKKWYFGHWHTDRDIDAKFRALWFDVAAIE